MCWTTTTAWTTRSVAAAQTGSRCFDFREEEAAVDPSSRTGYRDRRVAVSRLRCATVDPTRKDAMERRTKPNHWARRSLLYGAACFLLLQAGLLLSLERRGLVAFDPCSCNRLRLLRECRQLRPDSPLCIVVGSSRMDMAFQPETLPECSAADGRPVTFFNFCNYGAGPL